MTELARRRVYAWLEVAKLPLVTGKVVRLGVDIRPKREDAQMSKKSVNLFLKALRSSHADMRLAAMHALTTLGPHVNKTLIRALQDKPAQRSALLLLGDIAHPEAKHAVNKFLENPDFSLRRLASRILYRLEGVQEPEEAWGERQISVERTVPSLTTIVHSTWAEDEAWWHWPSDFPLYLDSITKDLYKGSDPFSWPGANTPEGREDGAKKLILWLKSHPTEKLTLIAHSHGGNVVFKATEIASPGEIHIAKLVLLGTPIRDDYAPNLSVIDIIHNIYSEDDTVQRLGAWTPGLENHGRGDGRVLPEAAQIQNRRVKTKTDNPHSELHTPELWKRERLGDILKESVSETVAITASHAFSEPDWLGQAKRELLVSVFAPGASVEPGAHSVYLPRLGRAVGPVYFMLKPERIGPLSVSIRIFLAREMALLQKLETVLEVESPSGAAG